MPVKKKQAKLPERITYERLTADEVDEIIIKELRRRGFLTRGEPRWLTRSSLSSPVRVHEYVDVAIVVEPVRNKRAESPKE